MNDALQRQQSWWLGERYHVSGTKLGAGGFADVFKGTDDQDNRPIAVKLYRRDSDQGANLRRFQRETNLVPPAKGLAQPIERRSFNIAEMVADDEWEVREKYVAANVYEFIDGVSLQDWVPSSELELLGVLAGIATALHAVHASGRTHRDLKRANILIDKQGEPCIVDFGGAGELSGGEELTRPGESLQTDGYKTRPELSEVTPELEVQQLGEIAFKIIGEREGYQRACKIARAAERGQYSSASALARGCRQAAGWQRSKAAAVLPMLLVLALLGGAGGLVSFRNFRMPGSAPSKPAAGMTSGNFVVDPPGRLPRQIIAATLRPGQTGEFAYTTESGVIRTANIERPNLTTRELSLAYMVPTLAWSPVDALLVLGSSNGTIYRWAYNLDGGTEPQPIFSHEYRVQHCAISPSGEFVTSIDRSGAVAVCRLPGGELVARYQLPAAGDGSSSHGRYVRWMADSTSLLVAGGGWDEYLSLWDFQTDQVTNIHGHSDLGNAIRDVACSPSGKQIAVAYDQAPFVEIREAADPTAVARQLSLKSPALNLRWESETSLLVRRDSQVEKHNLDGRSQRLFSLGAGGIRSWETGGLLMQQGDRLLMFNELGDFLGGLQGRAGVALTRIRLTRDGFVTADDSGQLRIWKLTDGRVEQLGDVSPIADISVNSDQSVIATGLRAGTVRVWNLSTTASAESDIDTPVQRVAWSPSGEFLVATGDDGRMRLFQLRNSSEAPLKLEDIFSHTEVGTDADGRSEPATMGAIAWISDDELLFGATQPFGNGVISKLNIRTREIVELPSAVEDGSLAIMSRVQDIKLFPDESFFVSSLYGVASYWQNFEPRVRMRTSDRYDSITVSKLLGGKSFFATGGGSVYQWDQATRQLSTMLAGDGIPIHTLVVCDGGERVVVGDRFGRLRFIDSSGQVTTRDLGLSDVTVMDVDQTNRLYLGDRSGNVVVAGANDGTTIARWHLSRGADEPEVVTAPLLGRN